MVSEKSESPSPFRSVSSVKASVPLLVHAAAGMKTPSSFRAASPHAAAHFGFGSKMYTRILSRANACSRPKKLGLRQLLPPSAR